METKVIKINFNMPLKGQLEYAASVLRSGGTVAFPTETVYGLGANALNSSAIQKIFTAKGRPSDNPLIVHIGLDANEYRDPYQAILASNLVSTVPQKAELLVKRFWPGPLTIVLPKQEKVPDLVTAGLPTVGVRMPSHPVALALIDLAGVPVAAPSANTSGKPSPTCAQHVIEDLYGKVNVILDGGKSDVGLESTVVDLTGENAVILRPGGVTPEAIRECLGAVEIDPAVLHALSGDAVPRAPGMKYTHYSPEADVIIVEGTLGGIVEKINELVSLYTQQGRKVGILATEQTRGSYKSGIIMSAGDRDNPSTIAESLFSHLRSFDKLKVDVILAEGIALSGIGLAVMNRMKKAAGYHVIHAE